MVRDMTTLTDQQKAGIQQINDWYQGETNEPFRLFGPAGTGKTTMAKAIPEALGLHNVRYGTYTGKAAHVLRSKGASPVSTIHSGIYYPTTSAEAREALATARASLAQDEAYLADASLLEPETIDRIVKRRNDLEAQLPALEKAARQLGWEWDEYSEWSQADLIILDEVSMVGARLAQDIEAYGVPVLVLGDPAQLPPVDGGGHYTKAAPDFLLTEIHRQALESPVLELATRVRLSTDGQLGLTPADMETASVATALEADQVLVWSNRRRWAMVTVMRRMLGRPEGQVVPGDRIMCLSNNKDLAVFNGQQFDVLEVFLGVMGPTLTVRTDEGKELTVPVYADGFQGLEWEKTVKASGAGVRGGRMLATFAQAITVHKAQGSEWEHVYVVNEIPAMISTVTRKEGRDAAVQQARQWMYTAATRASEKLTITASRA